MPAISSDVPIGYLINGDEKPSFMREIKRLSHLLPKNREPHPKVSGADVRLLFRGDVQIITPAAFVRMQKTG